MINYFFMVAEEVRELLASLGLRNMSELVGRADLMEVSRRTVSYAANNCWWVTRVHLLGSCIASDACASIDQWC